MAFYNGKILSYQRNMYCAVREKAICTSYAELANKQRRETQG